MAVNSENVLLRPLSMVTAPSTQFPTAFEIPTALEFLSVAVKDAIGFARRQIPKVSQGSMATGLE